jgi:outer membrane protein TolC
MKRVIIFLFLYVLIQGANAQEKNLDYYLDIALQNSPLLKDLRNQVSMNKLDSMRVRAGLGPQVMLLSNDSYAPVINGMGFDNAITNGANVSALLNVSKEISGKNSRLNRYEALSLQNQSVMNEGKISEQELKKDITTQYITAYGDWKQFMFNSEILDVFYREKAILKELTENGVYKQTEYLSFVVNLQQQEVGVSRLKNLYQNDFAMLNYLSGIEDTSFFALPDPEIKVESSACFSNTVFYKQFFIDSLKLKNAERQVDFSYRPKLNLIADGGYLSSLAISPAKNFGIDAGFSLSFPIFDGHQRKMQYDRISIEEQTRRNYLYFYNAQYRQQLNRLFQQLSACQRLNTQISNQISYAKTLMEASYKLLETGDVRISDYILSVGTYLNATNALVENTISEYLILNDINYWNREK